MLNSVAAGTCDTAQLVTRCCSKSASHSIVTILFGCSRGSVSRLGSISSIFRSNIAEKKSSFRCKLSSWSRATTTLLQPHAQKWRHSYSWNMGPRCSFPPGLPNYLLTLEDGLAKDRWVNGAPWAFCHSNHVLNECDIISCHGRPDPEGRKELTTHTPRTWFTLALHQLSVPLHFSQNLCESDLWFLSGILLAGYVSNKIKRGVYNRAPAIMDENSEVSSDRSERDRSLPDANSPRCWWQWSLGLP